MDVDLLISLVSQKPAIWDKKLKSHINRRFVDECWAEISHEMNENENSIRKKWKYLRDQFCVELGKAQSTGIESKWRNLKLLEFLKPAVTPRAGSRWFEETSEEVERDVQSSGSDEVACPSPKPKKRKLEREKKKPQFALEDAAYEERYVIEEEDEHLHFFKSILPHVKRIPHSKLLSFRSRLQSVVEEFAYAQSNAYGAVSAGYNPPPHRIKGSPRYDSEASDPINV